MRTKFNINNLIKAVIMFSLACAGYMLFVWILDLGELPSVLLGVLWGSIVMNIIIHKWEIYYFYYDED